MGLGKTGRIVTAAAWLLAIVFVGISTSDVAILKLFGVGVTLAVLVDAFLIPGWVRNQNNLLAAQLGA